MRIRPAKASDIERLVAGAVAMAAESEERALDVARVRSGMEQALTGGAGGTRYYVAEVGGAVAATLFVTREWSDWNAGWYWWIQGAYTWPEHRGQGLFKALHEAVLADARDADVIEVRLYVETDNPARTLYEGLGMKQEPYRVYGISP